MTGVQTCALPICLAKLGVKRGSVELDLDAMHAQRLEAVKGLTGGIEYLFKKNKVEWLKGYAAFTGKDSVKVGDREVRAKNIVIATGSSVTPLPGVEIDQKVVVDSTGALELAKVPEHLVVIGGGVIGLELGSVWRRVGAKVTVVEYLDQILPGMDGEVSKQMQRILAKQGIEFKLSTKVTGGKVTAAKASKAGVTLSIEPVSGERGGGKKETLKADVVLVAIGRRPCTGGLGLDKAGIEMEDRKSTRLNSSHVVISYAVFCLKKKRHT